MSLANSLWAKVNWLRRSSTLRLSLILSLIFAVGFAVAIFVALVLGKDANDRRVDASLAALAATTVLADAPEDSPAMIVRSPSELRDLPSAFSRVVSRGGGTVMLRNDLLRSETWRVLVTVDSQGIPVMIAIPMDDSEEARELLGGILWTTAGVVIALTLATGLATGLWAQRRLTRIRATLDQLATGDLTARTGHTRRDDDLDEIAGQLDVTAAELERLVTQTRHLSASIAHDLRTPLARLRARLETLPEGDAREAALEEAGRLSEIFDAIMRVARIEAARGKDGFERLSLGSLVDDVAEIFGAVAEDVGKELIVRKTSPAMVDADRNMLIQALANLIQNALVHGGQRIILFANGSAVGVSDNGDGVDPSQYDEIVKPMVRLDAARTRDGSGLGLALVRAVADRHGAGLELGETDPQGLTVTLNLAEM